MNTEETTNLIDSIDPEMNAGASAEAPEEKTPAQRESEAIAARFSRCSVVVANARNDAIIKSRMEEEFGFTEEELAAGESLLAAADEAVNAAAREQGEADQALADRRKAEEELASLAKRHLAVARVELKGVPETDKSLGLSGRRPRDLAGLVRQYKLFYNNLLSKPEWVEALARRRQTRVSLERGKELAEQLEDLWNEQQREEGEAQIAVPLRDAALEDLEDWVSNYLNYARLCFADDRQQLEKLGIVV